MATITTSVPGRDLTKTPVQENLKPDEFTGRFPVHQPTLSGIDQLLLLDDEWVILVINNLDDQRNEIDSLSSGQLEIEIATWKNSVDDPEAGLANGALDRLRNVRNEYGAEARKNLGELDLSTTAYYSISSSGDSNYSPAVAPSQAAKLLINQGGSTYGNHSRQNPGQPVWDRTALFGSDYNYYCYINFPTRMVDGETYTITLDNGKTATFTYDLRYSVSRAIKTNQVGYMSNGATNKAFLGAYLYEFGVLDLSHTTTFEVINIETQKVAFSGNVTLKEANPLFTSNVYTGDPMYGEDVYEIDLSAMTETGTFFIKVPGVGRSWPFKHDVDVFDYAYYTSCRALFQQRAGVPITTEYSHWPRAKAKVGPIYYQSEHVEKGTFPEPTDINYSDFDVIGGTIDYQVEIPEAPGGWHDAADWDMRFNHYHAFYDLIYCYVINSANHTDDQLDIPESGNGIPDILSEARHGLEIWRLSQAADGGVAGRLETWSHTNIDSDRRITPGTTDPADTPRFYAFSQRTRWTTLQFAAAAALYARIIAPFDALDAATYRAAAELAYSFGNNPANSLGEDYIINAKEDRGTGDPYTILWTELDGHVDMYLLHARLQLYLLTLDATTYLVDIDYLFSQTPFDSPGNGPYAFRFNERNWGQWIYFTAIEIFNATGNLATHASDATQDFIARADKAIDNIATNAYEISIERNTTSLGYGASSPPLWSFPLMIAYHFTGLEKYRDATIQNLNFALGCNPMGMSWTTGLGYVYPIDIQSAVSESDGHLDPVPGITLYGINNGAIFRDFRENAWRRPVSGNDSDRGAGAIISTLVQTGGTATATTAVPHGLSNGDRILITNASPGGNDRILTGYNLAVAVTVTGANTFTYSVDSGLTSPATGSPLWWHDFVDDISHRVAPPWRRWMPDPHKNVAQNEYTVHETIGPMAFALGCLYTGTAQTQKTPRPPYALHGQWYLP